MSAFHFSYELTLTSGFCAVVPLKHGLNYEVLEKGHVRFWLQAVKLSPAVSYRFIVNDKEVTSGEVSSLNSTARSRYSSTVQSRPKTRWNSYSGGVSVLNCPVAGEKVPEDY